MTVIAFDGRTLAADSQSVWLGFKSDTRKLYDGELSEAAQNTLGLRPGRFVCGMSGTGTKCHSEYLWLSGKRSSPPVIRSGDSFYMLLAHKEDGAPWDIYYAEDTDSLERIENGMIAIGAAAEIAMTLMNIGYTAEDAVKLCAKLSNYVSLPLQAITLDGPVNFTTKHTPEAIIMLDPALRSKMVTLFQELALMGVFELRQNPAGLAFLGLIETDGYRKLFDTLLREREERKNLELRDRS